MDFKDHSLKHKILPGHHPAGSWGLVLHPHHMMRVAPTPIPNNVSACFILSVQISFKILLDLVERENERGGKGKGRWDMFMLGDK